MFYHRLFLSPCVRKELPVAGPVDCHMSGKSCRYISNFKFIQIFINDIQPFFNPFCSVADDFKQSLCYKLWSDHRIEKCITVYRYCKKYVGIFRKKRTWFVRNDYNRGNGVMCHLCSYFILRRITRKTEQYQTICM